LFVQPYYVFSFSWKKLITNHIHQSNAPAGDSLLIKSALASIVLLKSVKYSTNLRFSPLIIFKSYPNTVYTQITVISTERI